MTDLIGQVNQLAQRGIEFRSLSETIDTTAASGRLTFHIFGAFAQFRPHQDANERGHEGRQGQGQGLRGKQPKLKPAQEAHLIELWRAGKHTSAELAELFSVARSTIYRAVQRAGAGGR